MNREDELFIARKTAERAGYVVKPPVKKEERPAERPVNRFERPSERRPISRLELAKKTAERAGFEVRRMSPIEQAKQVARDNGYKVVKSEPEYEAPKEKEAPTKAFDPVLNRATRFMGDDAE